MVRFAFKKLILFKEINKLKALVVFSTGFRSWPTEATVVQTHFAPKGITSTGKVKPGSCSNSA